MFPSALPDEAALAFNVPARLFTMAYTFLCVMLGGYVTARLSNRFPERHALILGLVQSALVVPAMFAFWDKSPLWGWIVTMIAVIPAAWFGGLLYARSRTHSPALA
jgi:hypothetical protein